MRCCNSFLTLVRICTNLTVDQQLAMVTYLRIRDPDTWKPSFHQQLQYVFRVSAIRFLPPHIAGTNLRGIPDTYFVTQLLQQLHEPKIVSYGFDAYQRRRSHPPVKSLGLSARVHPLVLFGQSSLSIEDGDLLETGMKITTYYDHRTPPPADPGL
jgi:hypothetical protein